MEATEQFFWAVVGVSGIGIVLLLAGLFFLGSVACKFIKRNRK